jgi:CHAT domain-containing protein
VLMQMHKQNPAAALDAVALAVSERARARTLLELLREARADIRQGIDASLLERERSLQQLLNAKAGAQFALLNRKHTPEQAEAAAKEIASLTEEYEEIRAQIRKSSPRYAALTQPQPLSLTEIQQQTLDPDTLLLEYSLGDNASYLFVVSHTSIASYRLPKRSEIEAATRRAYELLTAPQPRPGESEAKLQARIKEANASYWPRAAALSQILLGPAASQLGSKRLLIVADGALQYLPFGALPVPDPKASTSPRLEFASTPLMVEHEIVHLPSASALAALRRELAGRQPAPKAVAVLADPVFSADDARVKPRGKAQTGEERPSDLTRAVNDVRGELGRLLMTRDEAEAILSVTPRNGGLAALDFRANRATATGDELSNYRIVHFATHGLLNSEHPELSGLALSLVDEQGRPQDGFLRLHEIFNLRLPAELVVLSACRTGLGKEVKGEGLVGLTRGFMYAGAARVVASLWRVDDAATAELMKRFYRRMLQDGMRPAAALRAAQIEMWKKPQWQSPYYWGGFVLQGEWK